MDRLGRKVAGVAGMILAWLASTASAAPIVIVNASFEDVALGAPFFSSNVANVPGWTRSGAAGDAALWRVGYVDSGGNVTVAGDGAQFTTLGGGASGLAGSTTWSQTIGGFTVGALYELDFLMSAECGPSFADVRCSTQSLTAAVDQVADVTQVFTATNGVGNYWKDWEAKSLTFTADSTSIVLSFSANVPYDVGLDHVRITEVGAVPEPGSMALAALALAVLARTRRRS